MDGGAGIRMRAGDTGKRTASGTLHCRNERAAIPFQYFHSYRGRAETGTGSRGNSNTDGGTGHASDRGRETERGAVDTQGDDPA